jgi:hypothetical protein
MTAMAERISSTTEKYSARVFPTGAGLRMEGGETNSYPWRIPHGRGASEKIPNLVEKYEADVVLTDVRVSKLYLVTYKKSCRYIRGLKGVAFHDPLAGPWPCQRSVFYAERQILSHNDFS